MRITTSLNRLLNARLITPTFASLPIQASAAVKRHTSKTINDDDRSVYNPSAAGISKRMGVDVSVPTHGVVGLNSIQSPCNCDTWYSGRSNICNSDLTVSWDPSGSNNGAILICVTT